MALHGVTTFLWFDTQAMDAAELYCSLFPDARITHVTHYQEDSHQPIGTVQVVAFELFGRPFAALNGGPHFTHSPAVSFQVSADTQDELDRVWDALIADGGSESQCGWCTDRFGVSWQVTPARLGELLGSPDPAVQQRVWAAMMSMSRIDIATLEAAFAGTSSAGE